MLIYGPPRSTPMFLGKALQGFVALWVESSVVFVAQVHAWLSHAALRRGAPIGTTTAVLKDLRQHRCLQADT